MLSNRVLLWLKTLWKDKLCWDEGGCEGGYLFVAESFFKEEGEIGEGRGSGHILNITDEFTNGIFPSVNTSAILSV